MTVVVVTHESDIAAWARRRILFRDGHVVEDLRQRPSRGLAATAEPRPLRGPARETA
jgi:ABC-type polar amino acid transport system ATPase subunit